MGGGSWLLREEREEVTVRDSSLWEEQQEEDYSRSSTRKIRGVSV